jgi:DNA-binding LacI/PurR family transcriptional regulator
VAERRPGHVTLMDIARACGLSVSTVSIVLSEAPLSRNVAEKTRHLIKAKAQQLGYHPDAYARSLRLRRSQTIGILAYDLSDLYCIPIVRGIQEGLQPASYLPLLMDASTQRALFDSYLQMALERRAEGVIIIGNWVFDETNLLSDVEKNNVPIVIVSRDLTASGVSSVLVDNAAGGALALRHLYELGHRRIAVIRGPDEMFDSAPRWAGVQREAAQLDIRIDPRLVLKLPNLVDPMSGFDGGVNCARRWQASGLDFTAVIAVDDLTALGIRRSVARDRGDSGNHHDSSAAPRNGTAGGRVGDESDQPALPEKSAYSSTASRAAGAGAENVNREAGWKKKARLSGGFAIRGSFRFQLRPAS